MIDLGACANDFCREAREEMTLLHELRKNTVPEKKPVLEKVEKAISHIRSCKPCLFWLASSCCLYVKETVLTSPPATGDNLYTLHRKLHAIFRIEFAPRKHFSAVSVKL